MILRLHLRFNCFDILGSVLVVYVLKLRFFISNFFPAMKSSRLVNDSLD